MSQWKGWFDGLVGKASPRPAIRWSARQIISARNGRVVVADGRSGIQGGDWRILFLEVSSQEEAVAIAKNCPAWPTAPWWKCVKSRRNVLRTRRSSDGRTARARGGVSFRLTEQARDFNRGQSRTTTAWARVPGGGTSFPNEAGKMVSTLAGIFGIEHLGLAEDVSRSAGAGLANLAILRRSEKPLRVDHAGVSESGARRCPPRKSLPDKEVEITALMSNAPPRTVTAFSWSRRLKTTVCG